MPKCQWRGTGTGIRLLYMVQAIPEHRGNNTRMHMHQLHKCDRHSTRV